MTADLDRYAARIIERLSRVRFLSYRQIVTKRGHSYDLAPYKAALRECLADGTVRAYQPSQPWAEPALPHRELDPRDAATASLVDWYFTTLKRPEAK